MRGLAEMKSKELYEKAKRLIPGATQLLSKRPEMFGSAWPAYYKQADGVEIVDYDNNRYLDFAYMGIGTSLLGYNCAEVNSAVNRAVHYGNMSTLNAPEEVYLAEVLCELNDMDMVRYARTGGEAMAVAVRIARAYLKQDEAVVFGYHGWHDWYLSANLIDRNNLDNHLRKNLEIAGVPKVLEQTVDASKFNNPQCIDGLRNYIIVIEPIRYEEPTKKWVESLNNAKKRGCIIIADEITSGLRFNYMSAAKRYGIDPDIIVYGKALGNGFPIAAIVGKREVMNAAQDTFISSTYWTERSGFCAALATLEAHKRYDTHDIVKSVGQIVMDTWRACNSDFNVDIEIKGQPELPMFSFKENQIENKTLFIQEMIKRGFLATPNFYPSMMHDSVVLAKYSEACYNTFEVLNRAKAEGFEKYINGDLCHDKVEKL
jgi:glutamate-1-semialdehyde 2,1-aminomutase